MSSINEINNIIVVIKKLRQNEIELKICRLEKDIEEKIDELEKLYCQLNQINEEIKQLKGERDNR